MAAEVEITREQLAAIVDELGNKNPLYLSWAGPLLAVRFYVQSASGAGYTVAYYNRRGKRVDA